MNRQALKPEAAYAVAVIAQPLVLTDKSSRVDPSYFFRLDPPLKHRNLLTLKDEAFRTP